MSSYSIPEMDSFDGAGILPKKETQAEAFIKAHPEFDGRGVVVAVFDTGIDPGALGLQKTSTGAHKVIDILDASGSGDVDTSTTQAAKDGELKGLSGRTLKLGSWEEPPTGLYHLGIKKAYDIMPQVLVKRLTKERRDAFEKVHRKHLNELQELCFSIDSSSSRQGDAKSAANVADKKKELEAQIEQATSMMSSWSDPGPIYDVIAWKDTKGIWRVVVDTSESGDLSSAKVLAPYNVEFEYGTLGSDSMMNYSVNVWDDGKIVEIVTNAGSHGTHVGGIIGTYFEDGNDSNGIAPGCQLVSIKIGDSRLGSMETATSLVRGLIAAKERKVDMINLSYGESAAMANSGTVSELINELVFKHGIIFVASASNSGPCLTTVGSPGGTCSGAIPVAAGITPPMMSHLYSLRETLPSSTYTWSSRGPAIDGGFGVSITAPGGAIAPVPNHTLQRNQLMNGTSMSSPNACGGIALILSALKLSMIPYSPAIIRMAIENTAKKIENVEVLSQGCGMLQISDAFAYLTNYHKFLNPQVRISASVSNRRGIYIRDANHFTNSEIEEIISLDTHFDEAVDNMTKIKFETRISIHSTASWIRCPEFVALPNNGKSFKVLITPPNVKPNDESGDVFYGEVYGLDMAHPELGPIFRVPVTVVRPAAVVKLAYNYDDLELKPMKLYRRFYHIPPGATWATVTIKAKNWTHHRMALISVLQVLPDVSHKFNLREKYYSIRGDEVRVLRTPVIEGFTLEVTVGQFWNSLGEAGMFSFSVEFSGVTCDSSVSLSTFGEISKVMIHNTGINTVQPQPQLVAFSRALYPTKTSGILPLLSGRDLLPSQKLIHNLILTYQYTTDEANIKVLPRFPGHSTLLYDSPMQSQLLMIYDCNQNRLATLDYCPEWTSLPEKGTYTFRMQLRHEDPSVLEKFKNAPIMLERQMPKDKGISLSVYETLAAAIIGSKKFPVDGKKYSTNPTFPLYVQAPSSNQIPSYVKPGDILYGLMTLAAIEGVKHKTLFDDHGLNPDIVSAVPLKFVVPSKPSTPTESNGAAAPTPTPAEPTNEEAAVVETKLSPLKQLVFKTAISQLNNFVQSGSFADYETLLKEVNEQYADFKDQLKVKVLLCQFLEKSLPTPLSADDIQKSLDAQNSVISSIDQDKLAIYFGTRHANETKAAKQQMEEQKSVLIKALARKAILLSSDKKSSEFTDTIAQLSKWVDPATLPELESVMIDSDDRFGTALKAIRSKKSNGEKIPKSQRMEILRLLKSLGWSHWVKHEEQWNIALYCMDYDLF